MTWNGRVYRTVLGLLVPPTLCALAVEHAQTEAMMTMPGIVEGSLFFAMALIGYGFVVSAFPRRPLLLAAVYLPSMLFVLFYLGVVLAGRLHGLTL
jgi:hypothetical protein